MSPGGDAVVESLRGSLASRADGLKCAWDDWFCCLGIYLLLQIING